MTSILACVNMNSGNHSSIEEQLGTIPSKPRHPQKINPKTKVIILLLTTLLLLIVVTYEQLLFIFIWVFFLGSYYRVKWTSLIKKILTLSPVIIALSLLALISPQQFRTFTLMNFMITYTSLEYAMFMFLRSSILVFQALLLTESEPMFSRIIYALDELRFPVFLTNALFFMYRMTLDLEFTAKQLLTARYIRSYNRKWGRSIDTFQVLAYMIGNLFARAFNLKENRIIALQLRDFQGKFYHSPLPFRIIDVLLIWFTLLIFLLSLFITGLHFLPYGTIIINP